MLLCGSVECESMNNENRKCVDCEDYSDGKCGEDLQYDGGISCINSESTQCFKQIEFNSNDAKKNICESSNVMYQWTVGHV